MLLPRACILHEKVLDVLSYGSDPLTESSVYIPYHLSRPDGRRSTDSPDHHLLSDSPLGLCKSGPYGSREENFAHYRGVERKHGRIAMAATLGMLTQENYRFEGFLSPSSNLEFSEVPNGLKALDVVPLEGWAQIAVIIGAHELLVKQRAGKTPYVARVGVTLCLQNL